MFLNKIIIVSILFLNIINETPKDKLLFISPVKIPLRLSANFGELRTNHFHSGVDIKTQGVIGKEIVSAADGFIYRIGVSPGGFGKALYIRHPSGYSTVYAHLNNFAPEIEKYVKSMQYEKKSFQVSLFPAKSQFPVRQGDIIAYSGNSGSSGGPHLHYEIRKSENEKPVNPLLFEFGTGDNIEPVIEKLFIYPANRHTAINNQNKIKKINLTGGHGNYFVPEENKISIKGLAGFGIKSFDLLNDSYNKCAAYSIELVIDSTTVFKYVMDDFSFSESRYINSHIDYETFTRDKIFIQKTFVLPNDKLNAYDNLVSRGLFYFSGEKTYNAEIIVTDVHNNKSTLSFHIEPQVGPTLITAKRIDESLKIMPYSTSNKFESENISVSIPAGALYDTLNFTYKKSPSTANMLSDFHMVHNNLTPLHKPFTLSIKPDTILSGKESKMLIVQEDNNQKKTALNSVWSDGYLKAEAFTFGKFYIGIDSIPPEISPNGLLSGADLAGKKEIKLKINDDFSGIKSYEPTIDGKWALFEYDQKNNLLIYKFDDERVKKGSNHTLSLKVTDNKNNTSSFTCDFTW